jgi:hypothetical protein
MSAGTIDSSIGDRPGAKDEFVPGGERINPRRIFLHEEIDAEPFSAQIGLIDGIWNGFLLRGFCLEVDS